jgi:hypothetical protein
VQSLLVALVVVLSHKPQTLLASTQVPLPCLQTSLSFHPTLLGKVGQLVEITLVAQAQMVLASLVRHFTFMVALGAVAPDFPLLHQQQRLAASVATADMVLVGAVGGRALQARQSHQAATVEMV